MLSRYLDIICGFDSVHFFNSFQANIPFLYPLETSKKTRIYLSFSGVVELKPEMGY